MNRFFLPAAAVVLFLGAAITLRAEDWTASDGTHYENVVVLKVEADAVTILDRDGGGLIPLAKLPPDLQKRFGYDPAKAAGAAAKRAEVDRQNEQKLKSEAHVVTEEQKKEEAEVKAARAKAAANAYTDPNYFSGVNHHLGAGGDDTRKHYCTSDALSRDPDTSNHGRP